MVLGVGEGLEGLSALLSGDVTLSLKIVESENVLELWISVNDASVSVDFALLKSFH